VPYVAAAPSVTVATAPETSVARAPTELAVSAPQPPVPPAAEVPIAPAREALIVPAPIPELPPVALTLPEDSGLVLIETTHKAVYEPEPESPAGPRRARRSRVQLSDEPLQIVETRKDQPPAA
jgi:hypothetical protein